MKFASLLILSFLLVGCGKSAETKTKVQKKSLDNLNDTLSSLGLMVGLGTLTNAIGEHVIVICNDSTTTDTNSDNYDRATALKQYNDSLNGMDKVEFIGGTRVDAWRVEWAINGAIVKLEGDLSGKNCPAQVLGKTKI